MPSTSLKRKIVGMSEPLAALGQAPLATVDDLVGLRRALAVQGVRRYQRILRIGSGGSR